MSAGLAASTVTPGSTAPEASRTVPVRDAWAKTVDGSSRTTASNKHFKAVLIKGVFSFCGLQAGITERHGAVIPQYPRRVMREAEYGARKSLSNSSSTDFRLAQIWLALKIGMEAAF